MRGLRGLLRTVASQHHVVPWLSSIMAEQPKLPPPEMIVWNVLRRRELPEADQFDQRTARSLAGFLDEIEAGGSRPH